MGGWGERADRDAIKAGDNNHWPPLSTLVNLSIHTITKYTLENDHSSGAVRY